MEKRQLHTTIATVAACGLTVAAIVAARRRKGQTPVLPVSGRVRQGYRAGHQAVDIAVPAGTEVRCPWDGTVRRVWNDTAFGGGLSMLVEHDNGYTTGYAHLSGFHFGSGDRVLQGQNLALSGNTGTHTTGPHLHFTLRNAQGVKIDPQSVFAF